MDNKDRMKELSSKVGSWYADVLKYSAGVCLLAAVLLVSFNVFTRYVLGFTYLSVLEIAKYLVLWSTFLGAVFLQRKGGHLSVDFITLHLSQKSRIIVDTGACIVGFCFCLMLAIEGFIVSAWSFRMGEYSTTALNVPMVIPKFIVPIAGTLLAIEFARRLIGNTTFFFLKKVPEWIER